MAILVAVRLLYIFLYHIILYPHVWSHPYFPIIVVVAEAEAAKLRWPEGNKGFRKEKGRLL